MAVVLHAYERRLSQGLRMPTSQTRILIRKKIYRESRFRSVRPLLKHFQEPGTRKKARFNRSVSSQVVRAVALYRLTYAEADNICNINATACFTYVQPVEIARAMAQVCARVVRLRNLVGDHDGNTHASFGPVQLRRFIGNETIWQAMRSRSCMFLALRRLTSPYSG